MGQAALALLLARRPNPSANPFINLLLRQPATEKPTPSKQESVAARLPRLPSRPTALWWLVI